MIKEKTHLMLIFNFVTMTLTFDTFDDFSVGWMLVHPQRHHIRTGIPKRTIGMVVVEIEFFFQWMEIKLNSMFSFSKIGEEKPKNDNCRLMIVLVMTTQSKVWRNGFSDKHIRFSIDLVSFFILLLF